MLEPDYELDTDGLIKAEVTHHCTQPHCSRKIQKGELYHSYRQKGLRKRCLICVTRAQIKRFREAASYLDLWMERNA
jgi:hypothetical protein